MWRVEVEKGPERSQSKMVGETEREREKNETQNTKRGIKGAGWRPSLKSHLEQRVLGVSVNEKE